MEFSAKVNEMESSPLREGGRLGPSPTILKDFQLVPNMTGGISCVLGIFDVVI
jgi:hypothetical protein